jgi:NADH:ubiquinone oxidoreductase subunit E
MEVQEAKLDDILTHWKRDRSNLIEMLQDVQEHYRHIPSQVADTLAEELDVPLNRIFHIVKGGTRILENIMRNLGVEKEGQTTEDQLFSVESVRCLGCCGLAPVVTVGGEVYGNTSSVKMKKILDKRRKNEQMQ